MYCFEGTILIAFDYTLLKSFGWKWRLKPRKPYSPLCPQSVELLRTNIWSRHWIYPVPLQPVLSRLKSEDSMMPLHATVTVGFGSDHGDGLSPLTVRLCSHHHASLQELLILASAIKARIGRGFQTCMCNIIDERFRRSFGSSVWLKLINI